MVWRGKVAGWLEETRGSRGIDWDDEGIEQGRDCGEDPVQERDLGWHGSLFTDTFSHGGSLMMVCLLDSMFGRDGYSYFTARTLRLSYSPRLVIPSMHDSPSIIVHELCLDSLSCLDAALFLVGFIGLRDS